MRRHALLVGSAGLVAAAALLAASAAIGQDAKGPVARQPAGPLPAQLHAELARAPLPALRSAADVRAFVTAAGAAPVARREEIRAIVRRARENDEVAKGLIAEFEVAQRGDFSRALVALSLLGEQSHPAATGYLARFLQRPLPRGGKPTTESGISPEAEALERLQVKAANALPYARTTEAAQATLNVVRTHPLKAVRIEAASSYLWNAPDKDAARKILSRYLRKDELPVLDRPVRDQGMTGEQFNRQLAIYLDRHPELRAPAPARLRVIRRPRPDEQPGPPPPSEETR